MVDGWMSNNRIKETPTSSQAHLDLPIFLLPGIGNGISFSESHELLEKKKNQDSKKQGGLNTRKGNHNVFVSPQLSVDDKINPRNNKNISPLDQGPESVGPSSSQPCDL